MIASLAESESEVKLPSSSHTNVVETPSLNESEVIYVKTDPYMWPAWSWAYRHSKRGGLPVVTPAKLLYEPIPNYTDLARENRTRGIVRLRAILLPSGEVGDVKVLIPLTDGLTEQALEATRHIKFQPKTVDGQAVDTHVIIDYTFDRN